MIRLIVVCLIIVAGLSHAQTGMNADAFDAYSRGKTLIFAVDGEPYGAEEYLDDRRVRWSFLDGNCKEGIWYEADGMICFVYEDNLDPQCWIFEERAGGLVAYFEGRVDDLTLYEVNQSDEPMLCYGPDVGV